MLLSIIIVSLLPFLTFGCEETQLFETIDSAVKSLESRQPYYEAKKACYPDIGCFTEDGLMKHIGMLPSAPNKIGTKFYAYTADSATTPQEITTTNFAIVPKNKPLVIIIHGFNNDGKTEQLISVKDALLKHTKVPTVVMVDWKKGAVAPWYTEAALNTEVVGRQIAFLVETLRTKHSVDPKNVHLIGFSLGAQVSGFAGKFSQSQYKWKFGRISALDSAAPLFEAYPGSYLAQNDAEFVDAIHSSAGTNILSGEVGFIKPIGHVDFFPHDGTNQPRCENQGIHITCNHYSSVFYYEASISSAKSHCTAYKCKNWADFVGKLCAKNGDSRMGYYSNTVAGRGVHYSELSKDYPFCQN